MGARRCTRCETWYEPHLVEYAFRIRGHDASRPRSAGLARHICRPCEQTSRDVKKRDDRWAVKARDTISRHAKRLGVDKQDLIGRYGWEPKRLAHDAEFQYGNGCSYCGHQYAEMSHGYADITLDVVDRDKPPYYRTNTKWCCQTCNRKKGTLTPDEFEADRQMWQAWEHTRELAEVDPWSVGRLFN